MTYTGCNFKYFTSRNKWRIMKVTIPVEIRNEGSRDKEEGFETSVGRIGTEKRVSLF